MFKYYNNKRVKIKRFFILDGVHYSVVKLNGEDVSVPTSELSDSKSEFARNSKEIKSTVTKINPDGSEVGSTIRQAAGGDTQIATEWSPSPEDIVSKINIDDGGIVINSEKIHLNSDTTIEDGFTTEVFATSNSGKKIRLGLIEELQNSEQVKKLKFDIEAIQRCLDGKQKRHKNYAFSLEEATE